jgi:BON domain-containing protein
MSPLRYRDDDSSSTGTVLGVVVGAVAGFAVGMLVAQRVGGFSGLTSKLRRSRGGATPGATKRGAADLVEDEDEFEEFEEDELESEDVDESLEEHVLEAFRNDPILSERAIDIGSLNEGVIELAGWVEDEAESEHAVTIARGVPGVDTVINRIALGDEERRFDEAARRARAGDPSLTETHWEGRTVGTGRRRQGTSDEPDRHASPKTELQDRWLQVDDAVRNSADDTSGLSERRAGVKRSVRGDRTGGAPVAPTGVPKADHVAQPESEA